MNMHSLFCFNLFKCLTWQRWYIYTFFWFHTTNCVFPFDDFFSWNDSLRWKWPKLTLETHLKVIRSICSKTLFQCVFSLNQAKVWRRLYIHTFKPCSHHVVRQFLWLEAMCMCPAWHRLLTWPAFPKFLASFHVQKKNGNNVYNHFHWMMHIIC